MNGIEDCPWRSEGRICGNFRSQWVLFGFNKIIMYFETLWLENYVVLSLPLIFLANLNQVKPNVSGTVAVTRSVNKLTTHKITIFQYTLLVLTLLN